jgi:hypothetical protein
MTSHCAVASAAPGCGFGAAAPQPRSISAARALDPLGDVRIEHAVFASAQYLTPGRYEVYLTNKWLVPRDAGGQGMRWVEFRADGRTAGHGAALVIPAEAIHEITERQPAPGMTRVDLVEGGRCVQVWANRAGTNYLIHLPVRR